jgi:hypothetical protein
MWHVGMTKLGAIRNRLLNSVGHRCVCMWHGGVKVIGAIRKSLLYSVADVTIYVARWSEIDRCN